MCGPGSDNEKQNRQTQAVEAATASGSISCDTTVTTHVNSSAAEPAQLNSSSSQGQENVESNLKARQGPVSKFVSGSMILAVRCYQRGISPLLGKNCRYQPTCSEYFVLAVQKYGPLRGAWRGFWRIMRCHPFRPGGYDPP